MLTLDRSLLCLGPTHLPDDTLGGTCNPSGFAGVAPVTLHSCRRCQLQLRLLTSIPFPGIADYLFQFCTSFTCPGSRVRLPGNSVGETSEHLGL